MLPYLVYVVIRMSKNDIQQYSYSTILIFIPLRQRKQGGGVSLFIANHINYVIIKDINLSNKFNCVAIELYKESTSMDTNLI